MRLLLVKDVDAVWPGINRFAEMLEKDFPEWTAASLFHGARSGALQLWVIADGEAAKAAIFVEYRSRGNHTGARVAAMAGEDIHGWKHLWPEFKKALVTFGASSMDCVARKGFGEIFTDFKAKRYLFEVDLTDA